MATIQKGTVSTTEVLPDSMVIDMRDEVSMADEDENQFSTFTMKSRKGRRSASGSTGARRTTSRAS
jgi:hypothetical protein